MLKQLWRRRRKGWSKEGHLPCGFNISHIFLFGRRAVLLMGSGGTWLRASVMFGEMPVRLMEWDLQEEWIWWLSLPKTYLVDLLRMICESYREDDVVSLRFCGVRFH